MHEILITGGSGFLGSYIRKEFGDADYLGRQNSNNIIHDLADATLDLNSYETVIHAAGLAHTVPNSDLEKKRFHDVNVLGTKNLLESLEKSSVAQIIYISSVSVYGIESGRKITEDHPLLGQEAYALSKIEAEKLITTWAIANNTRALILRLPLIAGSNPPGNLGAMISAMKRGRYFSIGKAKAAKSMVLASDVADLMKRWILNPNLSSGIFNLTDSVDPSFKDIEEHIAGELKIKKPLSIPLGLAKSLALIGNVIPGFPLNSKRLLKITSSLTFDCHKAMDQLAWAPKSALEQRLSI